MSSVRSQDGTAIAFEWRGAGKPVILVDGALCYRASGPSGPLAELLSKRFTVFTYDRRGRGGSGDASRYDVGREVEDLEALLREAGGSASVFGVSSGAALALEAANRRLHIEKLALYEAPFIVDESRPPLPDDFLPQLDGMLASGRRGDAVRLFMKAVGVPRIFVALMRLLPSWSKLEAIAHTLAYDMRIVEENQRGRPLPRGRWSSVEAPTLVVDGGKSPAWMRNAMRELAGVVPGAQHRTLPGQTHMVKPKVLAPVLGEFFAG